MREGKSKYQENMILASIYDAIGKEEGSTICIARVKSNIVIRVLDPGEYVCRDVECPDCDSGLVTEFYERGGYNVQNDCPRCDGTGVVPERVG